MRGYRGSVRTRPKDDPTMSVNLFAMRTDRSTGVPYNELTNPNHRSGGGGMS